MFRDKFKTTFDAKNVLNMFLANFAATTIELELRIGVKNKQTYK